MQEGGEVVVALSEGGKFDAPGLCRTASSPCDADGERIEQSKTGDARNEIVKALILYSRTKKKKQDRAGNTHLVRAGRKELQREERPALPTQQRNLVAHLHRPLSKMPQSRVSLALNNNCHG